MTAPSGWAPMGVAVTELQVYKRRCVSVHGVLAATLYHTSAFHEFVHMHCCVCFVLHVCVCSDSNTLWQNDHTLLPRAPRNLSAPLPFLHQPQRRNVRSHVCQHSFPVGSGAALHLCLSSNFFLFLPTSSQEPLWHLTTKSAATGDGRTYGAHDMMAWKCSSICPVVNSCWRVSARLFYSCTQRGRGLFFFWLIISSTFLHFEVTRPTHKLSVLSTVFWVVLPRPTDTTDSEMPSWLVFLILAYGV